MLQRNSPIPLYFQLKQHLLGEIESGRWQPGCLIPGDEQLQKLFTVSRTTVRQALKELQVAGLVTRHRGRGTFVARSKLGHSPETGHTLTDSLRAEGLAAGWTVLEFGRVPAPADVADRLALPAGTPVFRCSRLRLAGDEPIGHQVAHAAVDTGEIDPASLREGDSLNYLRARGHLTGARAERSIDASAASDPEVSLLGVEPGVPMLRIRRVVFAATELGLEDFCGIYRGDRFQYLTSSRL